MWHFSAVLTRDTVWLIDYLSPRHVILRPIPRPLKYTNWPSKNRSLHPRAAQKTEAERPKVMWYGRGDMELTGSHSLPKGSREPNCLERSLMDALFPSAKKQQSRRCHCEGNWSYLELGNWNHTLVGCLQALTCSSATFPLQCPRKLLGYSALTQILLLRILRGPDYNIIIQLIIRKTQSSIFHLCKSFQ